MRHILFIAILLTAAALAGCDEGDTCCPQGGDYQFVLEETRLPDFNQRPCQAESERRFFTSDTVVTWPNIAGLCFVHNNPPLVCYVERHHLRDSLFCLDRSTGHKRFLMVQRNIERLNAAKNTLVCQANGREIWVFDLVSGAGRLIAEKGWRPMVSPIGKQLYYESSRDSGHSLLFFFVVADTKGNIIREISAKFNSLESWNTSGTGIYTIVPDTNTQLKKWVLLRPESFRFDVVHEYYKSGGGVICQAGQFGEKWLTISNNKVWKADIQTNSQMFLFNFCKTQFFENIASYDPLTRLIYFCLAHEHVNEDKTINFVEQHWYSVTEGGTDFREVKLNL